MVSGASGMNGQAGTEDTRDSDPNTTAGHQAGIGDRLSALLPFFLTMIADRSRTRMQRMAFRMQMLFWLMSVMIDQLEASRSVMERARDRLKDIDARLTDKNGTENGADW